MSSEIPLMENKKNNKKVDLKVRGRSKKNGN